MPIKAVIDIGTNSTRLLVAEITGKQTKDLHREARITRLGQGVDKNKALASEAIKRTTDVLVDYIKKARNLGATDIIIAATSAARDARNINSFTNEVKDKTGLQIKVLSPEQEATLSFSGTIQSCHLFALPTSHFALVLDIGGGSTELILGRGHPCLNGDIPALPIEQQGCPRPSKGVPLKAFSKDIGSVRLTEMFIKNDPPLEEELKKAADYIKQVYAEPVEEVLKKTPNFQMIGTAGTVTTLAALNLKLEVYEPEKVHCSTLSLNSVEALFNKLKKLTTNQRKELKTMQPGRADVIVTGALILLTLMKMLGAESLIVSEKDILDGLLLTSNI